MKDSNIKFIIGLLCYIVANTGAKTPAAIVMAMFYLIGAGFFIWAAYLSHKNN